MASDRNAEFEFLYLNGDGQWVSVFKAEWDAPCFAFYSEGYAIPAEWVVYV